MKRGHSSLSGSVCARAKRGAGQTLSITGKYHPVRQFTEFDEPPNPPFHQAISPEGLANNTAGIEKNPSFWYCGDATNANSGSQPGASGGMDTSEENRAMWYYGDVSGNSSMQPNAHHDVQAQQASTFMQAQQQGQQGQSFLGHSFGIAQAAPTSAANYQHAAASTQLQQPKMPPRPQIRSPRTSSHQQCVQVGFSTSPVESPGSTVAPGMWYMSPR